MRPSSTTSTTPARTPGHWVVTGAAGFIGARMIERCRERGLDVTSVDELSAFDLRPEHAGIDFGRRISKDELIDALRSGRVSQPDAIIHLGACSSTTELDVEFLRRVNVDYSKDLWNYCSAARVPFIYASSAATSSGLPVRLSGATASTKPRMASQS
mgnify:CR=1 FL=1